MQSKATTPEQYINELPEDRKTIIADIRKAIKTNLPKGFEENISYGMLSYCVPFSLYPKGYHCTPNQPLPFISVASQKNHIAIYHMGLYSSTPLYNWFVEEWKNHSTKKLDMGKSCIRFKKAEDIPVKLIAALAKKMTPTQWIEIYQSILDTREKK